MAYTYLKTKVETTSADPKYNKGFDASRGTVRLDYQTLCEVAQHAAVVSLDNALSAQRRATWNADINPNEYPSQQHVQAARNLKDAATHAAKAIETAHYLRLGLTRQQIIIVNKPEVANEESE